MEVCSRDMPMFVCGGSGMETIIEKKWSDIILLLALWNIILMDD